MLFRSFLQAIALFLFGFVFLLIVLILAAYAGYLGPEARLWVEWGWSEVIVHQGSIQKAFAVIGAASTLTISALGIYKTWHFADLNLPTRLEALCERWRQSVIRHRIDVVPELRLVHSITALPDNRRSFLGGLLSLIYDGEQASLLKCSRKVDKFEAELKAVSKSYDHCRTELLTGYLELGSRLRRSDPANSQGALNLFKKPLEIDTKDWDALELAGRQALAAGLRDHACDYLVRLIDATNSRHPLRHARALRFHAEILHGGTRASALAAHDNLERAIIALEESDARDPHARTEELGMAHEMLAKVQISLRRFRLARTSISKAAHYVGDTDRLRELLKSATPQ